jgi:hypothetical protein
VRLIPASATAVELVPSPALSLAAVFTWRPPRLLRRRQSVERQRGDSECGACVPAGFAPERRRLERSTRRNRRRLREDGSYLDPLASVAGRDEISALIATLCAQMPGTTRAAKDRDGCRHEVKPRRTRLSLRQSEPLSDRSGGVRSRGERPPTRGAPKQRR